MKATEAFERDPSIKNLIQLKDNEALYAISELTGMLDIYPNNAKAEAWKAAAAKRAKMWEDKTVPVQYHD
ncbi:hypothetical protein LRP88_11555 [Fusarium phalaenopsidis]